MYIPLFMQGVLGALGHRVGGGPDADDDRPGGRQHHRRADHLAQVGRYKWASLGGLALMAIGMWLQTRMGLDATARRSGAQHDRARSRHRAGDADLHPGGAERRLPRQDLGAVTAAVQFFRSIGSTIGVALMGTLLDDSAQQRAGADLPPQVAQRCRGAAGRAQSAGAGQPGRRPGALETQLAGVPDGAHLFAELMDALQRCARDIDP